MPPPPLTPAAAKNAQRKSARKVRRALITTGIVLGVLLGIVLMLPFWASSQQGRQYALTHINRQINGTLKVKSWSLGWFSGIRMENVELDDSAGAPVFECDSVQSDLTLWRWFWGSYDLGNTILIGPHLWLSRDADGTSNVNRVLSGPASTPQDAPDVWSTLRGSIRVQDGRLDLAGAQGFADAAKPSADAPIRLAAITAEIPIASPTAAVHLVLTGQSTLGDQVHPVEIRADLLPVSQWARPKSAGAHDAAISQRLWDPNQWLAAVAVHGGALPTATLASWLGLDPRWQESLGPAIDEIGLDSQSILGKPIDLTFRLQSSAAIIQFHAQVDTSRAEQAVWRMSGGDSSARMRLGQPALELLGLVNPAFAQAQSGDGSAELYIANAQWTAGALADASGHAMLRVNGIELQRLGLIQKIETVPGPVANPTPAMWHAEFPALRLDLAEGRLTATPMIIERPGGPRLTFSGDVGLDHSLRLFVTMPLAGSALGGGTIQIPIRGTVESPIVDTAGMGGGR